MINNDLFENDTSESLTRVQLQIEQASAQGFNTDNELNACVKLRSIWVSVAHAEQLHLRHFYRADRSGINDKQTDDNPMLESGKETVLPGEGRSVFMLHGEAECGRVFYGSEQRGLAWYLAKQGYEVFVADLGARGRSLLSSGEQSQLTVNELITGAIPRLLQACGEHSSYTNSADVARPDIWIGHGFGAVLLSAAWARLDNTLRSATQMVFMSARRRVQSECFSSQLFSKLLCHRLTGFVVRTFGGVPAKQLNIGSANENAAWYQNYMHWFESEDWVDCADGFDYREGLIQNQLPPILHLAPRQATFYSSPDDTRCFVEELGTHNARLVFVDRNSENGKAYNHLSMLLSEQAEHDVFADACVWLSSVDAFDQNMQRAEEAVAVDENQQLAANYPADEPLLNVEDDLLDIESLHADSDDRYPERRDAISFA